MKKLLLALSLLSAALAEGQVNVTGFCSVPRAAAGQTITCSVAISGTGQAVGFAGQTLVTAGVSPITWAATTPLVTKTLYSAPGTTNNWELVGLNATVIPASTVLSFSFIMPSASVQFAMPTVVAVDSLGGALTVTVNPPVAIALQSNCDINGDGLISAADVTAEAQATIAGPSTQAALSSGLSATQKVSNAITGMCVL